MESLDAVESSARCNEVSESSLISEEMSDSKQSSHSEARESRESEC